MGSGSIQPVAAAMTTTLTPMLTLESHKVFGWTGSMAYFPDGKRIISVSRDKTIRHWDLQVGKEIEAVRDVYEGSLSLAMVSRDGRWIMTSGGNKYLKLKVHEVETGIVKTFQDSRLINCIDISADGKLLASGSALPCTVLVWSMDTGKLVAGPFESHDRVDAIRFSPESNKLAVKSEAGKYLEVWDVLTQKLDARVGKEGFWDDYMTSAPVFWTKKGNILSVFNFDFDDNRSKPTTIYEFDASTLRTVGHPFKGHTDTIDGLALSFDGFLLASSSFNNIKLWSVEPRQLFASFHLQHEGGPFNFIISPDTRQLAYSADNTTFICTIPSDILTSIRLAPDAEAIVSAPDNSTLNRLLNSGATRRRANVRHKSATSPMISLPPRSLQPLHTRELQQPTFLRRLRNLLTFSSHLNAVPSVQNSQPRDPLDIPAPSRMHDHNVVAHTTQGHSYTDVREHSRRTEVLPTTLSSASSAATFGIRIQHLSRWWRAHASHSQPPIVDVAFAPGRLRHAAAGAPRDSQDLIPEEYFDTSSQNPDSQQQSTAGRIDTGEHGHGKLCFCF